MVTLLDFPQIVADKFPVRHVEFVAVHFESIDPEYVSKLEAALGRTQTVLVNIVLDVKECAALSDPDSATRSASIGAVKRWIDVARQLGARSVRVDPGKIHSGGMQPTIDSYKVITEYAQARGMSVIIENVHKFGTRRPEEIVELIKLVGLDQLGALPDFANFTDPATRTRGLSMLFRYAKTVCHAKGQEFNAEGVEQTFDFPQAMEIARNTGFKGIYSIEFNGQGGPYAGIQNTLNELLHYI